MSDPLSRLPAAFGRVLAKRQAERRLSTDTLAGLLDTDPRLTTFFRIANALGDPPAILLVDVISEWRADPSDYSVYKSRASDFARLYRLGYLHKPGDFRELATQYYSVAEAVHAAGKLNAQRYTRGVALLDTVTIYVRLDYVSLQSDGFWTKEARS